MGQYLLTDTDPSIIFPSKSSPKLLLAVETATTDKRTNVSSVCQFLRLLKQSTVIELALFSRLATKFFSYWEKNLLRNFDGDFAFTLRNPSLSLTIFLHPSISYIGHHQHRHSQSGPDPHEVDHIVRMSFCKDL